MSNNIKNTNRIQRAGLGARLGAFLLDALIVCILYSVIAILITLIGDVDKMLVAFCNYKYASVFFPYRLLLITYTLVWFTYSTIMEAGAKESTWGKRVAKIRVVYKDGTKAKGLDIVVRNIIKYLPRILPSIFFGHFPSIVLWIIYTIYMIIILCNKNHRGIYDFIGGTMVICEKAENVYVSHFDVPMMQNVIPANSVQPQRPVNVPMQGQAVNVQVQPRPVSVPVTAPTQSVNIQVPQRPVSAPVTAPTQSVNIQVPQRPVSAPVTAPTQAVNIQVPQRPVNVPVPAPGGPMNINVPTKLVCLDGMYSGAQFSLDKPVIMGLDANICTIIFRNDTENVGKVHCRVELLGGKVYLEDLGSTYATYANEKKLNPYEKVQLELGDCVKIGTKEIFILK